MTVSTELLTDAFGRIRDGVERAVAGLDPQQLSARVDGEANSIAWLVWHLTRVQDDHLNGVIGGQQVWTSGGWMEKFGLPFAADATGYGHTSDQVGEVRGLSSELLVGYHDAVSERTIEFLEGLSDDDLERIVDRRWDPPVTLGVRLVSVISDDLQHVGQAAFARGILQRV